MGELFETQRLLFLKDKDSLYYFFQAGVLPDLAGVSRKGRLVSGLEVGKGWSEARAGESQK